MSVVDIWTTYWPLVNMIPVMVSMDEIRVIGQHYSRLWCPWRTYGSLVNMVVAYDVMVSPMDETQLLMVSMDEIRVIRQHGSRLWCSCRIYGSLVNMVVAYGVLVSPMDEIRVIGQHVAYGVMVSPMDEIPVIGQLVVAYGVHGWHMGHCSIWSLVNMVVAYGVMVSPMDEIWDIGQHGRFLWCPSMRYGPMVNMLLAVLMDEIRVICQHGSRLWCPWRTYGSLVNMVVAYGVMVSPMDEIRVIGQHGKFLWCPWMRYGPMVNMLLMVSMDEIRVISQHGSRLWCPWRTFGSLVNMVVAYGVMVSPMDDIQLNMVSMDDICAIGQYGSYLWCPWIKYGSLVNMVVDYSKHAVVNKCIEMRIPNTLFRNGLMKLFFLETEHEGKTMLEEASALGHLDSTFVPGMMLMAEGRYRKQEALDMLNNAYRRANGLKLRDAYFGWAVLDDGEYTGVVDRTKELLRDVGVVHRLTMNNITFQCEDPRYSVEVAFAISHGEDEDRLIYCIVFRWYAKYVYLRSMNKVAHPGMFRCLGRGCDRQLVPNEALFRKSHVVTVCVFWSRQLGGNPVDQ
ncbi:unnamed protein product [Lactuca saligna]|uniref:At2g35280-like TPR domain-containing protein n=1 Tax=Lactuca saligna TaxID=75948 RepID=A0AA35Z405_LACSI|nr:unnamed protein product [Lactuca saligna]